MLFKGFPPLTLVLQLSWGQLIKPSSGAWCMSSSPRLLKGKEKDHSLFSSLCNSAEGHKPQGQRFGYKREVLYPCCWKKHLPHVVVKKGTQLLCSVKSKTRVTLNSHWKNDWFCSILLLPAKHCRIFSLLLPPSLLYLFAKYCSCQMNMNSPWWCTPIFLVM